MSRPIFWFPDADQIQAVAYLSVIGFVVYCVGNFLNLALPVFYVGLMWLSLGSSCLLLLSWWANRPAREACQLLVYADEVFQNRFAVADKLGSLFVPILLGGFSKTAIMSWWVATLTNAMSRHGVFGLTHQQAIAAIERIAAIVREWKTHFEEAGVTGQDIDRVATAFQHPRELGLGQI